MVLYILHGNVESVQVRKCEAVAKWCNVKVNYKQARATPADSNCEACPVLDTMQGSITGSNAICFYLAGVNSLKSIGDHFTTARALTFLDAVIRDLEVNYYRRSTLEIASATEDIQRIFDGLDSHYMKVSFAVGERRSFVDVALNAVLQTCAAFEPNELKIGVHLKRFMKTIGADMTPSTLGKRSAFYAKRNERRQNNRTNENKPGAAEKQQPIVDTATQNNTAALPPPEKHVSKVSLGKNVTEIPIVQFGEGVGAPDARSEFDLEQWKREYANAKNIVEEAMPWFFEHFKPEDFTIYKFVYDKMDDECTAPFLTSNMLGGFIQRIDPSLRKRTFCATRVIGKGSDYNYEGTFMFAGSGMPKEMVEHPSFEVHKWAEMKLDNEEHKKMFIDILASKDTTNDGEPVVDFKLFK